MSRSLHTDLWLTESEADQLLDDEWVRPPRGGDGKLVMVTLASGHVTDMDVPWWQ